MGLAILPSRLQKEMKVVRKYLLDELLTTKEMESIDHHIEWATDLKMNNEIDESNVDSIIENGIGKVFSLVLEDCGVFKKDKKDEFIKFIQSMKNKGE